MYVNMFSFVVEWNDITVYQWVNESFIVKINFMTSSLKVANNMRRWIPRVYFIPCVDDNSHKCLSWCNIDQH